MYSVPLRSVQMFLHAMVQVWHPMHLSRWKTIATCDRISIVVLLVRIFLSDALRRLVVIPVFRSCTQYNTGRGIRRGNRATFSRAHLALRERANSTASQTDQKAGLRDKCRPMAKFSLSVTIRSLASASLD